MGLWSELYRQGDSETASITWIIEAHNILLKLEPFHWNYLGYVYVIMES
jgi:hypothetical protein